MSAYSGGMSLLVLLTLSPLQQYLIPSVLFLLKTCYQSYHTKTKKQAKETAETHCQYLIISKQHDSQFRKELKPHVKKTFLEAKFKHVTVKYTLLQKFHATLQTKCKLEDVLHVCFPLLSYIFQKDLSIHPLRTTKVLSAMENNVHNGRISATGFSSYHLYWSFKVSSCSFPSLAATWHSSVSTGKAGQACQQHRLSDRL